MALTYTPSPDLGKSCPSFKLPGADGQIYSQEFLKGARASVVMFICNHCPYVKAIEDRLVTLGQTMISRGVKFLAISSNDAEKYPDDSFENIKLKWKEKSYPFPYLYDETQSVAREFGAVCTPDFFVYDNNMKLVYRGRLDDSWKDASAVKSEELRAALDAILEGRPVASNQAPSMGCNIKWKI